MSAGVGAAALLFIAGRLSTYGQVPTGDDRPEFALLLYEGATFDYRTGMPPYFAEYSAWAQSLSDRGLLVKGRALDFHQPQHCAARQG